MAVPWQLAIYKEIAKPRWFWRASLFSQNGNWRPKKSEDTFQWLVKVNYHCKRNLLLCFNSNDHIVTPTSIKRSNNSVPSFLLYEGIELVNLPNLKDTKLNRFFKVSRFSQNWNWRLTAPYILSYTISYRHVLENLKLAPAQGSCRMRI